MSYYSQNSALKRQQQQAGEMRQRQLNAQNQATNVASRKAAEFDPNTRREQQQDIQQEMTGELEKQVAPQMVTAQGVQVGQTIPGGTADYTAAKAREQVKTTESLRALASLMGRIGSASELRKKEAVGFGDAAGQIGRIQSGAGNMAGIDALGVEAAGQPNAGMELASAALRAYGGSRASAGGQPLGGGGSNPRYPEYGQASGPSGAWL
jgi:hypothetical protein